MGFPSFLIGAAVGVGATLLVQAAARQGVRPRVTFRGAPRRHLRPRRAR